MAAGSQTRASEVWGPWVKEAYDHSGPDSHIDGDGQVFLQVIGEEEAGA